LCAQGLSVSADHGELARDLHVGMDINHSNVFGATADD
jgi:hypothetical protein